MNLFIPYTEITEIIEKVAGVQPTFAKIDDKKFEVSYDPSRFLPTIRLGIGVKKVNHEFLSLTYDSSTATSLVISGVVSFLRKKLPDGVKVNTDEKIVDLYFRRFPELVDVLEYVNLLDIVFDENGIYVTFTVTIP